MQPTTPIAYSLPGRARIERARPRDPTAYWAVRRDTWCLDEDGRWDVEPAPGRRDELFLKRFRFPTALAAYQAWRRSGEEPKPMMGETQPAEGAMPYATVVGLWLADGITVERTTKPGQEPEKWAVRRGSRCLSKTGEWELEPTASNRTLDFAERCRWLTAEEAVAAVALQP